MSFPALALAVDAAVDIHEDFPHTPPGLVLDSISVWIQSGDAVALARWVSVSWFDPRAVS